MAGAEPSILAHSAPTEDREPQLYAEHVENVRSGAVQRARDILAYASNPPEHFLEAIIAAATFHDLGKLDPDTQAAMKHGRSARLKWDHIDAGVAHLTNNSSWMGAWLVRAHHAPGLPNRASHIPVPDLPDPLCRKLRGRRKDEASAERHNEQIDRTDQCLEELVRLHEEAVGQIPLTIQRPTHGLTMRLALSCLVDADHADTAQFDTGTLPSDPAAPRWVERLDRLCAHVRSLPTGDTPAERERNRHRTEFFDACLNSDITDRRVACEAPVGMGKTTAVTAYLLRRAVDEGLRRLIIVAPYTNILKQTAETLRKALTLDDEDENQVVLEHHHRVDMSDRDTRAMAVLWKAPIVLTTAVSFFETLASCHPGTLRKLNAVPGSAVFIDEAHAAMPASLWPQNWLWLEELASNWGCRFVFASGTLARFWENDSIVKETCALPELLPPEQSADVLRAESRRVRYVLLTSDDRIDDVLNVEELIQRVVSERGPRLVILNTVQNAAVVARQLRNEGYETVHLSTALTPADRDEILNRITRRLETEEDEWTLVATSCVEAGLNLSFRCGFRERIATASLIQAGGRVNRNAVDRCCPVYDFALKGNRITQHPAAAISADVLRTFIRNDQLSGRLPSSVVTEAMAEELKHRPLEEDLYRAEKHRDYPRVAMLGRIIQSDTRLVVVDNLLKENLADLSNRPSYRELLRGSVQLWAYKVNQLRLQRVRASADIYLWNDDYEPDFLGIMAGILANEDFLAIGGAVV